MTMTLKKLERLLVAAEQNIARGTWTPQQACDLRQTVEIWPRDERVTT